MCFRFIRRQVFLLLFALTVPVTVCAEAQFTLTATPAQSNDGRVVVSWESPTDAQVHIQQGLDGEFKAPSAFLLGFVVFVATLPLIIVGARRHGTDV